MEFTYNAYLGMLQNAREKKFRFCGYEDYRHNGKTIVLRHDIDFSIDKALEMAIYEESFGVKSTYFVLLTSGFYNVFQSQSIGKLKKILGLGHRMGLHFDEKNYDEDIGNTDAVKSHIIYEINVISDLLQENVNVVSYHRPSKSILDADLSIPGIINSYSDEFFKRNKYVSDSRRVWREPIRDIINNGKYEHIQILTHPFWYNDAERTIEESLRKFVDGASMERYEFLQHNFSKLEKVLQV